MIAEGHTHSIDIGRANGRRFLLMAGVGIDGEVVHRVDSERVGPINRSTYFKPILQTVWNYRYPNPERVPGAVSWPRHPPGPRAVPGWYTVELVAGETVRTAEFEVLPDPRYNTTPGEYAEQFGLLWEIHESLDGAHEAVNTIRDVRGQINSTMKRAKSAGLDDDLKELAESIKDAFKEIEETIIQTKSKSSQDPLNFPIRLNDKIGALAYTVDGDHPPTAQSREVFEHLDALLQEQLSRLETLLADDIPAFNDKVLELRVPSIVLDDDETEEEPEEDGDEDEDGVEAGPWGGEG